jgi:hypothetical protein
MLLEGCETRQTFVLNEQSSTSSIFGKEPGARPVRGNAIWDHQDIQKSGHALLLYRLKAKQTC